MALEEQAPEKEMFKKLLEKRTNDILYNPREKLWRQDSVYWRVPKGTQLDPNQDRKELIE